MYEDIFEWLNMLLYETETVDDMIMCVVEAYESDYRIIMDLHCSELLMYEFLFVYDGRELVEDVWFRMMAEAPNLFFANCEAMMGAFQYRGLLNAIGISALACATAADKTRAKRQKDYDDSVGASSDDPNAHKLPFIGSSNPFMIAASRKKIGESIQKSMKWLAHSCLFNDYADDLDTSWPCCVLLEAITILTGEQSVNYHVFMSDDSYSTFTQSNCTIDD